MSRGLYIALLLLISFSECTPPLSAKKRSEKVKRQKKRINQSCPSAEGQKSVYAGLSSLVDEPKSVTEKNFQNYIVKNYTSEFPQTVIMFEVIFQPGIAPCCRQTNIADSLKMDARQIDLLTALVLKYPVFSTVQFNKDEKVKYLRIYLGRHKKGELSAGFGY